MVGAVNQHLDRGIALKLEGNYDEALVELRIALSDDPESADAHHQLGLVLGFSGEFDDSIESLLTAISLNADNITAMNDLALTYAMIGLETEAKAGFEAVLAKDPGNAVAKKNLVFFG